jgi:hypothetical protein|tara:strand:- start:784 stop:1260 length:477 start_codon:yes stop_codon:yes gene_type:complete
MDLTTDLGEKVAEIEGLVDKRLKLGGLRFTYTQLVGTFALLSTIVGSLYGGFLMYQKVEGIANLDLDAIAGQMAKTSSEVLRIEEHANAIKIELKKDMTDLRNSQWNLESKVDIKLQSVDTKLTNYDTKLDRFEIKVEKTKEDLMKRIQQSLDNPLSN